MRKLTPECEITLPDAEPGLATEHRVVLVQPNQAVMIVREPGVNPWAYLSGYDFTEGHDEWTPGHA